MNLFHACFVAAGILIPVSASFMKYDYAYDYGGRDALGYPPKEKDCRAPPIASSGIPPYPIGATYRITCPEGYELTGAQETTCNRDGDWTVPTLGYCRKKAQSPMCVRPPLHARVIIAAQSPPLFIEGSYRYQSGGFIRYACETGYRKSDADMDKDATIYCGSRGQWSASPITCVLR